MNPTYLDKGYLQIFVTEGETLQPISNASVRISDPENGQVLEETTTDTSGQTPFVELPAPLMELSVAEGESEKRPYAVYNVTISAAGWETLHIGGVELLPTSRSIQQVALAPARLGGFNVRNILLPPHGLWGGTFVPAAGGVCQAPAEAGRAGGPRRASRRCLRPKLLGSL